MFICVAGADVLTNTPTLSGWGEESLRFASVWIEVEGSWSDYSFLVSLYYSYTIHTSIGIDKRTPLHTDVCMSYTPSLLSLWPGDKSGDVWMCVCECILCILCLRACECVFFLPLWVGEFQTPVRELGGKREKYVSIRLNPNMHIKITLTWGNTAPDTQDGQNHTSAHCTHTMHVFWSDIMVERVGAVTRGFVPSAWKIRFVS